MDQGKFLVFIIENCVAIFVIQLCCGCKLSIAFIYVKTNAVSENVKRTYSHILVFFVKHIVVVFVSVKH